MLAIDQSEAYIDHMSASQQPNHELGDMLNVSRSRNESLPKYYNRLGEVAMAHAETPLDINALEDPLHHMWQLSIRPTPGVAIAARPIDPNLYPELALDLSAYAEPGRRGVAIKQHTLTLMARLPFLGKDAAHIFWIERDLRVPSQPANNAAEQSSGKLRELLTRRQLAYTELLFWPPNTIAQLQKVGVPAVRAGLLDAQTKAGFDTQQAFYTEAFRQRIVKIPKDTASTRAIQLTERQTTLLAAHAFDAGAQETSRKSDYKEAEVLEEWPQILGLLGAKTKIQAFFIALRDRHIPLEPKQAD